MRRRTPERDQAETPFSGFLLRLCETTCMQAAALVDQDGETVDYAGYLAPFDIRVLAAEWRIVLEVARAVPGMEFLSELVICSRRSSFLVVPLNDGYALVGRMARGSFGVSRRALAEAMRDISREAGLTPRTLTGPEESWTRVQVRPREEDRRRPSAVWAEGQWEAVEILGRIWGGSAARNERAYRVRLPAGKELTLVREALGTWYADEAP